MRTHHGAQWRHVAVALSFALAASCSDTSMSSGKSGKAGSTADATAPTPAVDGQQAAAPAPAATAQDAKVARAPGADAELAARAPNNRDAVEQVAAAALTCDKVVQTAGGWGATGSSAISFATCKNLPAAAAAVQYVFCREDGNDLSACAPYAPGRALGALSDAAKAKFASAIAAINVANHAACLQLASDVNAAKVQDDTVACLRLQNP